MMMMMMMMMMITIITKQLGEIMQIKKVNNRARKR